MGVVARVWFVLWRMIVALYALYDLGGAPGAAEGWKDFFQPLGIERLTGLLLLVTLLVSLLPASARQRAWAEAKKRLGVKSLPPPPPGPSPEPPDEQTQPRPPSEALRLSGQAAKLSEEVMTFVTERDRQEPTMGIPKTENWDDQMRTHERFRRETKAQYQDRFQRRIAILIAASKRLGLAVDPELEQRFGFLAGVRPIHDVATRLGVLADELKQIAPADSAPVPLAETTEPTRPQNWQEVSERFADWQEVAQHYPNWAAVRDEQVPLRRDVGDEIVKMIEETQGRVFTGTDWPTYTNWLERNSEFLGTVLGSVERHKFRDLSQKQLISGTYDECIGHHVAELNHLIDRLSQVEILVEGKKLQQAIERRRGGPGPTIRRAKS